MTQQPTPQDQATLIYRIEVLERLFHELQQQLQQYVRASENNLHLQAIKETVLRIELELQLAKNQLSDVNAKLTTNEIEAQKRDAEQRANQDKLQIWILVGIVSFFVAILLSIIAAYAAHVIH